MLQNTVATLPCLHPDGNVTWSRYVHGEKVTLVTIKNGHERSTNKRYGSLVNYSLVITNVKSNDSAMYFCNGKEIYLEVTTDPNMVAPNDQPEGGNVPVTQMNDRLGFDLEPGQRGTDATAERASDVWKVFVGAVIGVALVLLAILTLRFCSKKRAETNTKKTVTEVIYEEIGNGNMQQMRESDVECPYSCTSIFETSNASTAAAGHLYTVNKLKTKGRSDEECVYSLV